jgi:hypothetical protein
VYKAMEMPTKNLNEVLLESPETSLKKAKIPPI